MLFLGHMKSDWEMKAQWLTKYELHSIFVKQFNIYNTAVAKLRLRRWVAHKFSKSKTTGSWVSENYRYLACVLKLILAMPCLRKVSQRLANKPGFVKELGAIKWFVDSAHVSIATIMGLPSNDSAECIRKIVPVYLDSMAEVDAILTDSSQSSPSMSTKKKSSDTDQAAAGAGENDKNTASSLQQR